MSYTSFTTWKAVDIPYNVKLYECMLRYNENDKRRENRGGTQRQVGFD